MSWRIPPDVNSGGTLRNVPPLLSHRSLYAVSFDGYFGQGLLAENWQIIGPSATVLQAAAWEEKVQKAYFETFTIIQTLLFLPGMLD